VIAALHVLKGTAIRPAAMVSVVPRVPRVIVAHVRRAKEIVALHAERASRKGPRGA